MDLDEEDYEFTIETSTGTRNIVMSKTSLGRLAGSNTAAPEKIVMNYRAEIQAIVERKIAKGRVRAGEIRLHGTDL